MGWERKRGKLHELNRLLRGATDTSFAPVNGASDGVPPDVRYVVTLDADTQLPREAVKRLVGTMAHPLNRPRFDARCGRVVEGYGVLQPRITPPLPGGESSVFQRLSAGPAGIDPYAAATSDVYQDLFGEGSYTGKGIYDVDAFEAALTGRVPVNVMLSHDLFEGAFARAGLVSDVELFEHAPSHYGVASARQHRWARGDWQLLPWIFASGSRSIPAIGRWKMLDNLRRTLSAPAALLTLAVGWTLPGAWPVVWTAFVLATIGLPTLLPVLTGAIPRGRGISKRSHVRAVGRDLVLAASQTAFVTTLLAYQAWLMTDAIVRTVVRVGVTHRKRLEWTTAARAKAGLRLDLRGFYRRMAGGVTLACVAAVLSVWVRPAAWPIALPFLLLWAASPAVARWSSLPWLAVRTKAPSAAEARALRLIARRTWRFFTTFVGAEDHALPPDNFQEDPNPVVAHRTSPTNLGLYLLATVAARDFGWLGTVDTVERLEATLQTMMGLERFRGHFYNWYATRDLRALDPRYVSSVDSGNLAGHLITLAHACRELIDGPRPGAALAGIADAVSLVRESLNALADRGRVLAVARRLEGALDIMAAAIESSVHTPGAWAAWLAELEAGARMVTAIARSIAEEDAESAQPVLDWAEALRGCVDSHLRDLQTPAPALAERLAALAERAQTFVVARQISYGAERGVPWGVSESSYNVRDLEMTYQYSNFGVPGLGLRFGLVDDVVIAPYATGLAAMIDPSAAVQNFLRLEEAGALGAYGFYEALDYTAQRRPEGTGVAIVRTYMAHHQGMVIVAIANVLHDGAMRARFHAEPIVQATELLLQERTPRDVAVTRPRRDEVSGVADVRELAPAVVRRFTSPHAATPRTHLLSNGRYAVMMTAAR